ncbi:TetR/AcrR family transcriptional regulator [Streptomyces sp. NBC_00876]|uniref:TetR/AcrR family transcriptional regulator n=1 Tax=Streptomyces sp. NBC_00876 TaxID=2975853 RepID=UPI00386384FE
MELIEEGDHEAFSIAALNDKAQVAPRALYDRTTNKDALFLAVHEHGISRAVADQQIFSEPSPWRDLDPGELITAAVTEFTDLFRRHAAFLKAVVLLSGAHPEVQRRGRTHVHALADTFTALLLRTRDHITQPDPDEAAHQCFATLFSTLRGTHRPRPRLRHTRRDPRRPQRLPGTHRPPHPPGPGSDDVDSHVSHQRRNLRRRPRTGGDVARG